MGRRLRAGIAATLTALAVGAPAAHAVTTPLPQVRSFALALGTGTLLGDLSRYEPYDLVVVDGDEVTAAQVTELKSQGAVVLGYLSVGTIERWRTWAKRAIPYRLGRVQGWSGEHYADTSKAGYRRLVLDVAAPPILAKGLDGLFLDNVDMIETHPRQRAGMYALVRALAARVHARPGGVVMAQNGAPVMQPLVPLLDAWNREDVSATFDGRRYRAQPPAATRTALAELRAMKARGLLVTATDYTAAEGTSLGRRSAARACSAGAVPFVSNIDLTRIPAQPLTCP